MQPLAVIETEATSKQKPATEDVEKESLAVVEDAAADVESPLRVLARQGEVEVW